MRFQGGKASCIQWATQLMMAHEVCHHPQSGQVVHSASAGSRLARGMVHMPVTCCCLLQESDGVADHKDDEDDEEDEDGLMSSLTSLRTRSIASAKVEIGSSDA